MKNFIPLIFILSAICFTIIHAYDEKNIKQYGPCPVEGLTDDERELRLEKIQEKCGEPTNFKDLKECTDICNCVFDKLNSNQSELAKCTANCRWIDRVFFG